MLKKIMSYSQADYSSGRVTIDEELCTGCQQCTIICPATALEMNETKHSQMIEGADCISCGACTAVCHTTAITIESFYRVPSGVYQTMGRVQPTNEQAFPRVFTPKFPHGVKDDK